MTSQSIAACKYDFDPDAIVDGTYVAELAARVRSLEQDNWVVPALLPESPQIPRIPSVVVAKDNAELTAKILRYITRSR